MNEWALALWAMTASHHQWPARPVPDPPAIVRAAPVPATKAAAPPATLPEKEREELRKALDQMAPLVTGRLVWDPVARLYVPELKSGTQDGKPTHR